MSKFELRKRQMSEAAYMAEAKSWANALVESEARGPGDIDNAMRRVEAKWGIPYGVLWGLRYRPSKEFNKWLRAYFALKGAFSASQMRKLRHELERTKAIAGRDHPAVRAAEALVGARDGTPEEAPAVLIEPED